MPLKLVLFINDEETYASCNYPPTQQDLDAIEPTWVYVEINGLDKSPNYPDNYPSLDDFQHEYKILWRDEE